MLRNVNTAKYYRWGEVCDGWRLLERPDLSVIREPTPARDSSSIYLQDTMATKRKNEPALPIKDEEDEHPIPLAWRPTLREVVSAFTKGDYRLACGVPGVDPVSAEQAKQFQDYLVDYGATLVELPDATWKTSVARWYDPHWDFLVDLWTVEEGNSDLVLSGSVSEIADGFRFTLRLVYVP